MFDELIFYFWFLQHFDGTAHQTEKGQHLKFILSHDENFDSVIVGTKAKILFQYRITSNRQPLENIQSFFFFDCKHLRSNGHSLNMKANLKWYIFISNEKGHCQWISTVFMISVCTYLFSVSNGEIKEEEKQRKKKHSHFKRVKFDLVLRIILYVILSLEYCFDWFWFVRKLASALDENINENNNSRKRSRNIYI